MKMCKVVDGLTDMADVICNTELLQNVSKKVDLISFFILVTVRLIVSTNLNVIDGPSCMVPSVVCPCKALHHGMTMWM